MSRKSKLDFNSVFYIAQNENVDSGLIEHCKSYERVSDVDNARSTVRNYWLNIKEAKKIDSKN